MTRLTRARATGDTGSAIILTMVVMAVLTGLGMTVFALSTDNLGNARRDRQASSALANSEAGVAQAVAYIKNRGVGKLACAPNCNAANPWGESSLDGDAFPSTQVTLANKETYSVWIETIQAMTPTVAGLYRVHSVGNSGTGPGARTVEVDLQVAPFEYPLAVVADSVQAGGSGAITTESLFSTGCIFKRDKINFAGIDPVYGKPAAAHSAQYISDSQATGSSCASTDTKNIHKPTGSTPKYCNTAYPYDQDKQGGPLAGTACETANATYGTTTSLIEDTDDLEEQYGFNLDGLTAAQIDQLRTSAQEQGFYYTTTNAIPAVLQGDTTALAYPNPVIFYEFASSVNSNSRTVDLNDLSDVVYGRATPLTAADAACHGRNVIVVVRNGDVKLNSNQTLVASVFALGPTPYGNVLKANGTSQLIGTLYARSIDLTGTADIDLDDCFLGNLPGQLLNVEPGAFREVDR